MPNAYTCLHYHVVFSTKQRHPWLEPTGNERLFAFIGGIVRDLRGRLIAAGGTADHLHLLMSLHPSVSLSDLLRQVKSSSSAWIHATWPELRGFAWQDGYAAFTVSRSAVDDVEVYIGRQAEHHTRMSFQDELREFLRRHGVAFDERYVWG